jgi:hypothetical protein
MTYARLVTALLATLVLTPPVPAMPREAINPAEQALLCIYRGLDWDADEDAYEIRTHDSEVGGLPEGSFLYHFAPPGRHIVFVSAGANVSRSFLLLGGETYYIRVERRGHGTLSLPKLLPVALDKGVREVRKLIYAGVPLSAVAEQSCQRKYPRLER